jgi:hypothetical protein
MYDIDLSICSIVFYPMNLMKARDLPPLLACTIEVLTNVGPEVRPGRMLVYPSLHRGFTMLSLESYTWREVEEDLFGMSGHS